MPSYASPLEEAVFQNVVPQLEAEGFSVFVHPSRDMLPPFLSSAFHPDAIAYKGDRKIAIEVMPPQSLDAEKKLQRLQKIFAGHSDWELRVVYAPSRQSEGHIPQVSKELIEERLKNIEKSLEEMGASAALLTAWATFEAAARRLLPTSFGAPQTPARLVETMASEGYVTPDEADRLRELGRMRNEVAHGHLDLRPSREGVESLIATTRSLLGLRPDMPAGG